MTCDTSPGKVVWFTGYSGSGKSTICNAITEELTRCGERVCVLDGDRLRQGLCADLGYAVADRAENVRRIAHIAHLLSQLGFTVLVAAICPLEYLREIVRSIVPSVVQVFVDAPIELCESRDPKGLYKKARAGLISDFTGVASLFEPPSHPDIVCHTDREHIHESAAKVINHLRLPSSKLNARSEDERRRTIAVDFDGVIANYDGWKGETSFGSPRPDVRLALHCLRAEGWKIVVHTTRTSETVEPYLLTADVPFDEINKNSDYANSGPKPVATVYWDDRALFYSGDASKDLERIRTFRTWSRRS